VTEQLPPVNSLLPVVFPGDEEEHPSRLEDCDGPLLAIAAPCYAGDLVLHGPGATLALRWTAQRGLYEAPAELVEVERRSIPLWRVRLTGPVRVLQRRRYARAEVSGPVSIHPVDGEVGDAVDGSLVDVGEGGLRCRMDDPSWVRPGLRVEADFTLDDAALRLPGEVLRILPVREGDRGEIVVVVFDEPVQQAELIRRFVLQQQLQMRRAARA